MDYTFSYETSYTVEICSEICYTVEIFRDILLQLGVCKISGNGWHPMLCDASLWSISLQIHFLAEYVFVPNISGNGWHPILCDASLWSKSNCIVLHFFTLHPTSYIAQQSLLGRISFSFKTKFESWFLLQKICMRKHNSSFCKLSFDN